MHTFLLLFYFILLLLLILSYLPFTLRILMARIPHTSHRGCIFIGVCVEVYSILSDSMAHQALKTFTRKEIKYQIMIDSH